MNLLLNERPGTRVFRRSNLPSIFLYPTVYEIVEQKYKQGSQQAWFLITLAHHLLAEQKTGLLYI